MIFDFEFDSEDEIWLTYQGAARRVGRDVSTIKRWRREGMPMEIDDLGRRVVHKDVLLAEYRARLTAWPIHQQKMRVLRRETPPEDWGW